MTWEGKDGQSWIVHFAVAYTAEEVEYKWLEGNSTNKQKQTKKKKWWQQRLEVYSNGLEVEEQVQ